MHQDHKRNFSYLNFHTEFSVSGDNYIEMATRACFHEVVRLHKKGNGLLKINEKTSNEYHIRVYYVNDVYGSKDENNCCLLSPEELDIWIKDMQRFAEFEYSITKDPFLKEDEASLVTIKFTDRPFAEHFLVLELIKHSYEFPFNLSVYQAVKMRDIINKDELLVNIHNMIFCCNRNFCDRACSDHVLMAYARFNIKNTPRIGYFPFIALLSADEIKERCKHTEKLVNIFNPCVRNILQINGYEGVFYNSRYDSEIESPSDLPENKREIYDYFMKFEYTNDAEVNLRVFDDYFNVEECKKRLDLYIKTYDAITNGKTEGN